MTTLEGVPYGSHGAGGAYVFRTAYGGAELYMQQLRDREKPDTRCREVRLASPPTWQMSITYGKIGDLVLSTRTHPLMPDHRFKPDPLRADGPECWLAWPPGEVQP